MNWQPGKCRGGDIIRVNLGIIHHYGVFVSEDEIIQFGLPPIPENRRPQNEVAVLATDIDTFACGKIVEIALFDKSEKAKAFPPEKIISRAKSRLGETGYNLIHNNCEHFVNECAFGVKYCSVEDDARKRWNNRPILDVYFSKINGGTDIKPVFPPERDREIADCKNEKLKICKYADWVLLDKALSASFHLDISSLEFEKTKHGKWLADKVFFSLSHSGDFVCAAVSNMPVGVDIESEDAFKAKWSDNADKLYALAQKVFTRAEFKSAATLTARDFIRKWTLKEAIFKRNGKGGYRPRKIESNDKYSAAFRLEEPNLPTVAVSGEHLSKARFFVIKDGKPAPVKVSEPI